MIDAATLEQWTEQARRDDWHENFRGSDIRMMLGDIGRLRAELKRSTDSLALLIAELPDPGSEALAALHTGRALLHPQ